MKLTRKEAIAMFDTDVEDGALYGRSPEAFEQWCEDNDVEVTDLQPSGSDTKLRPSKAQNPPTERKDNMADSTKHSASSQPEAAKSLPEVSNLVKHAQEELQLAGLFDKDSDYDGMLGDAVLELVKVFAKQGHSGFSASLTLQLFNRVANYKNITPIGSTEDEWMNVSDMSQDTWQNKRRSSTFSRDGGKTWYDIDDPKLNNGDTWAKTRLSQRLLRAFRLHG